MLSVTSEVSRSAMTLTSEVKSRMTLTLAAESFWFGRDFRDPLQGRAGEGSRTVNDSYEPRRTKHLRSKTKDGGRNVTEEVTHRPRDTGSTGEEYFYSRYNLNAR